MTPHLFASPHLSGRINIPSSSRQGVDCCGSCFARRVDFQPLLYVIVSKSLSATVNWRTASPVGQIQRAVRVTETLRGARSLLGHG